MLSDIFDGVEALIQIQRVDLLLSKRRVPPFLLLYSEARVIVFPIHVIRQDYGSKAVRAINSILLLFFSNELIGGELANSFRLPLPRGLGDHGCLGSYHLICTQIMGVSSRSKSSCSWVKILWWWVNNHHVLVWRGDLGELQPRSSLLHLAHETRTETSLSALSWRLKTVLILLQSIEIHGVISKSKCASSFFSGWARLEELMVELVNPLILLVEVRLWNLLYWGLVVRFYQDGDWIDNKLILIYGSLTVWDRYTFLRAESWCR